MIKGYKIRLYPTVEQQQKINEHFGACRFIWNKMIDIQQERRYSNKSFLSSYDMIKTITIIKKEERYSWLRDVSTASLQRMCLDLNNSYQRFFKKISNFPKYKSKKGKLSYPVSINSMYFLNGYANIEKIGKIRYRSGFVLPEGRGVEIINPRIKLDHGKYILSFCLKCENQAQAENKFVIMGIDLGVKKLATVSFENEDFSYENINYSNRLKHIEAKIKFHQKAIGRKIKKSNKNKKGKSNNCKKEEVKLRKLLYKAANIRKNYIHQITHKLISMNPSKIVMEDLDITGMLKDKKFNKFVNEQTFGEFLRQMKYKSEWAGIEFIQADRYFPSSKQCSKCGNIFQSLSINDRTYVCKKCGLMIDRDLNAAINLKKYAM